MNPAINGGEGSVQIRVSVEKGAITRVALSSTRPVHASSILVGRPLDEAMTLLPRLFGLCGVAQAVAGLTAAETALDITSAPAQIAARRLLVAAESLDQTIWRILLDWPRCVGAVPDINILKRLRRILGSLRPLLFPDPVWNCIGGARLMPNYAELAAALDEIESGVKQAIFDRQQWVDRDSFAAWLPTATTSAALTLRFVDDRGLADFGRSADDESTNGENGAFARLWRHPLIAALRADYGNGLLTRLAARVIECGVLVAELRNQALMINADPGMARVKIASGCGIGSVECARGRLTHRLAITEGRVADYQILAPTEVNFDHNGPLALGLTGALIPQSAALDQVVELLIIALDPCVGFALTIEGS